MDFSPISQLGIQCISYEKDTISRYEKYFKNIVFYDIGAYKGLWSLAALINGANSVVAFEPDNTSIEFLRQNLSKFRDRYRCINEFVTDLEHIDEGPERTTIDHFIDYTSPGFIKIDVEGHEMEVLRGAEQTIRKSKPYIMIEAHDYLHPNIMNEIKDLMLSWGYHEPEIIGPLVPRDLSRIYHMFFIYG